MPVTRAALEETLLLQDREPRLHGRRVVNAERLLNRDPLLAVRGSEALEDRGEAPIPNPVRRRLFYPEPAGRVRYLSDAEDRRLRDALPDAEQWARVRVAMLTGLDSVTRTARQDKQVILQTSTARHSLVVLSRSLDRRRADLQPSRSIHRYRSGPAVCPATIIVPRTRR